MKCCTQNLGCCTNVRSVTAPSAVTATHVTMSASGLMKAVILSEKPATRSEITYLLSISDSVPEPEVMGDQVLVRVRATALSIDTGHTRKVKQ